MANQTKPKDVVGLNLTLPAELHATVKSEAAKARKTLSAYVIECLRVATKTARAA